MGKKEDIITKIQFLFVALYDNDKNKSLVRDW